MKTLFTLIATAIFSFSFAQIKVVDRPKPDDVGQIRTFGMTFMTCKKLGDTYIFSYKDDEFKTRDVWKDFKIKDVDNAFENLYSIVKKGFEDMPSEDIMLEFPDGYLWLSYSKSFGKKLIRFGHAEAKTEIIGFSNLFNEDQIDKLFGKKK